jgi:parallel beta-helix repeat protein
MVGLSAYFCQDLIVKENDAGHNVGFGFYLYESSHCQFEGNLADHCSRTDENAATKPGAPAGASGFLLVHGASHNTFTDNRANLCTNGFRLVGLSPEHGPVPCRGNRFLRNTAKGCTQAAFADCCNAENEFSENVAENANTGVWLDHVSDDSLKQNTISGNRRAGVAARNSTHCDLLSNTIQDNRYGVLIWQVTDAAREQQMPERETSKFWRIQSNTLHHNDTAIRIAAQPENLLTSSQTPKAGTPPRPHDHEIRQNVISDNRLGIQTVGVNRTVIKDNHFTINLMGDIKS